MAKSKKDAAAETGNDPFAMGQALMKQVEDAGLGPMRWMGTAWFEAMADMNSELASFIADRIREDVKTQHELLHCKSTQDLQRAQLDFLDKAYAQYTAETGKLLKMGIDMLPTGKDDTKDMPL